MKTTTTHQLPALALLLTAGYAGAVTTTEFFDPDFAVQPAINPGIGFSSIDNDTDTQASGPVEWTHTATGHTWANVVVIVPVAQVQLASTTQTTGDSLIFGRRETANLLGGITVGGALSNLVTAGLVHSWDSSATVTMPLTAGQTYQLDLLVTSPALVSADVLGSASVGISGGSFTQPGGSALLAVDLLTLADIDVLTGEATVSISFVPTVDTSSVTIDFAASSLVGLDILGGNGDETQNVLTFSNFSLAPVPEPSVVGLSLLAAGFLMRRQRRK